MTVSDSNRGKNIKLRMGNNNHFEDLFGKYIIQF